MPYDYNVQANIIHASQFQPTGSEHILLDTQILLWMFYSKFSSPMLGIGPPVAYQLKNYPNVLKSLISAKSMLYYSGLNLPELFHQVERFECGLHTYQTKIEIKPKQFWILTDGGDFTCVKGITVITENQSVLADAYHKGLVK